MSPPPVTAVIVNHRTPDLVERAISSLLHFYPRLPLLLIDNGSHDRSIDVMERFRQATPSSIEILVNPHNLHHGPAMDQAMKHLSSRFVLFMDSDSEVVKEGFVEQMSDLLDSKPNHYIAGERIFMNKRGFNIPQRPGAIPYIRPICMMVRRDLYQLLPPFERHGTPCLANMTVAQDRRLVLIHFPVGEYISHLGRGTAGKFGYQLGWKGKLNYLLNKFGL